MGRPLAIATTAWAVAVLAALAGVLLPLDRERLSLALFAFAVGLALLVALFLVADGVRHRAASRRDIAARLTALRRLEHLPSVTTATRRLRWRGTRCRVVLLPPASRVDTAELRGDASAAGWLGAEREERSRPAR